MDLIYSSILTSSLLAAELSRHIKLPMHSEIPYETPKLKKKKKKKEWGRAVNTCSRYAVPYVVVNWVYELPYVDFLISGPYITLT